MNLLEKINQFVWGMPALLLIVGVGVFLTVLTGFPQLRFFPKALKHFWRSIRSSRSDGSHSQKKALFTALAATVGTGNIIGVAGAIILGGPGAVFWMWLCAFLGMATKFAEATLAVRYRKKDNTGACTGGPMYMIKNGLGRRWNWLAVCYCIFGLVASFGVGNATQVNACITGVNALFLFAGIEQTYLGNLIIGGLIAVAVAAVLFGGAKRIGEVAESLVPFAAVAYILLCAVALILNYTRIPTAFALIVKGAFSPKAATGGMLGSAFCALRVGASRGTFTNEAGMGTASIAHANADVSHPVEQGLMGIVEVFLDTICICTLTALVILCSEIRISYGIAGDGSLTADAFVNCLGEWTAIPLALSVICFGIATIFGWSLYGGRCAQFLFGDDSWKWYALVQTAITALSAAAGSETVWLFSEILNGLMAVPNLIVLVLLSPELKRLIKTYCIGNNLTKSMF